MSDITAFPTPTLRQGFVGVPVAPATGMQDGDFNVAGNVYQDGIGLLPLTGGELSGDALLGFGSTPTARLDIGGPAISLPSWTTSGVALRVRTGNYTDNTGSGTIATRVASSFGIPTFASSNATTLTAAATVYIAGPPNAGTNTTITQAAALVVANGNTGFQTVAPVATVHLAQAGDTWSDGIVLTRAGTSTASLFLDATDGSFNIGRTNSSIKYFSMNPTGNVTLSKALTAQSLSVSNAPFSQTSWTTTGVAISAPPTSYTDTSGSGAIANRVACSFGIPTFASASPVTLAAASTVYIAGPPNAGVNTTITQAAALVSAGGNWGINTSAPMGQLQIAQTGDIWSSGFILTRTGTSTASLFLDATDGSFNIGRANASNKFLSMNASGDVTLSGLLTMTKAYTVATLPAAAAGNKGARAYVTDASSPTFLGTLTGGGSVVCPVFSNGTAWVSV